jgi:hypothetical protein
MYFTLSDEYRELLENMNLNHQALTENYEETLKLFYQKYQTAQHISSYLYSPHLHNDEDDEDGWFQISLITQFEISLSITNEHKQITAEWKILGSDMINKSYTDDFIIRDNHKFNETITYIEGDWYQEEGKYIDIAYKYDHNEVIYEKYKCLETDYDKLINEFNKQSHEIHYVNTEYKTHLENELIQGKTSQNIFYMGMGAIIYATLSATIPVAINYLRR